MKLIAELTDKSVLGIDGISSARPRYTSRALLQNSEGKFAVMLMKKYGFYCLPGGGIDPGEDEISALRREILEETGCSCDAIEEIGCIDENRAHCDYTQISYYYFVRTNGKITETSLTDAEKATKTEVQWHSFEEVYRLINDFVPETNQQKFLKARDMAILNYFKLSFRCEKMIFHIMKKSTWEERKNKELWGKRDIEAEGFIHCSQPEYLWRVAPNFDGIEDALVILCIDEGKLSAEVKYEDGDNCGRSYPHIYGPINNSAVTAVLPFLRDENGRWIKNPEFSETEDL
ncbi:MAG: DUF952 domain-containing protein [Oscillospiraceae bacterium]|nr:DUF952 domain-containing protein [Oscillospiraceae bacterium]